MTAESPCQAMDCLNQTGGRGLQQIGYGCGDCDPLSTNFQKARSCFEFKGRLYSAKQELKADVIRKADLNIPGLQIFKAI